MVCGSCGKKKATVHLTEIVDGQMTEMHLCESCAHHKSAQMEQQFGLADLLVGLSDFGKQVKEHEQVKLVCPQCEVSYDDFKKFGRLGCSECYGAFRNQLSLLFWRISARRIGIWSISPNMASRSRSEERDFSVPSLPISRTTVSAGKGEK